jgi:hypothetical protein
MDFFSPLPRKQNKVTFERPQKETSMRKAALCLILILTLTSSAYALEDGRTTHGVLAREGIVMGRGVLNLLGFPFELIRTPIAETQVHKWVWPVTFIPRAITNVIARASSATHDLLVYPWLVPFTDDLSPITEPLGLPTYVWGKQ